MATHFISNSKPLCFGNQGAYPMRVELGYGFVDLIEWGTLRDFDSGQISTVAPWQLWLARRDQRYRETLRESHLIAPDGNGVCLLLRLYGINQKRITGREIAQAVYQSDIWSGRTRIVVGGSPEAVEVLNKREGLTAFGGDFSSKTIDDRIAELSNWISQAEDRARAVLIVALGSPRQEYLCRQICLRHPGLIAIGVGGAVEVIAGTVLSPPIWVTKYRLEFAYRAIKLPHLRKRVGQALCECGRLAINLSIDRGFKSWRKPDVSW
ncbi:WecB/TagA/CpsF family glycosyltransferase [Rhodococcus sp. 1168]|uniref:WecB/TagA/CpsF family glycosyltransferase n=1 Tax=Rhodococcus sp. 1168 TaxID=2018041 RepID=UPI000B5ABE2A